MRSCEPVRERERERGRVLNAEHPHLLMTFIITFLSPSVSAAPNWNLSIYIIEYILHLLRLKPSLPFPMNLVFFILLVSIRTAEAADEDVGNSTMVRSARYRFAMP
jgi:hypothetical protein